MSENHTPTPWRTPVGSPTYIDDRNGRSIAICHRLCEGERMPAEANAAFIIRACNSHDTLVKTLEKLREYLEGVDLTDYPASNEIEMVDAALSQARA